MNNNNSCINNSKNKTDKHYKTKQTNTIKQNANQMKTKQANKQTKISCSQHADVNFTDRHYSSSSFL